LILALSTGLSAPEAAGAALPGEAPAFLVQLTEEEKLIPSTVSAEEAARILLEVALRFEDRGELQAARLLLREIVDRYDGTVAAAQALERLSAIGEPAAPPPEERPQETRPRRRPGPVSSELSPAGLDQTGRVHVIVYSTLLSAWVGLAVPIYAEADNSEPYGLGLLLGAPAGLLASITATRNRRITAAQADIIVLSGNMGLWHALALGLDNEWEGPDVAGATALGGLAGLGTGTLLVSSGRTRETSAALAGLAATYGAWFGLVGWGIARGDEDILDDDDDPSIEMLITSDAALVGSVLLSPHVTFSRPRARLVGVGGIVGGVVGLGMVLLFDTNDDGTIWALLGAGTLAGLGVGVAVTADYDVDRGFLDPPRADQARPGPSGPMLSLLRPRLIPRPHPLQTLAGPEWRARLNAAGFSLRPGLGLSLLEASF
jgi:hypothetical protein